MAEADSVGCRAEAGGDGERKVTVRDVVQEHDTGLSWKPVVRFDPSNPPLEEVATTHTNVRPHTRAAVVAALYAAKRELCWSCRAIESLLPVE